LQRRSAGLSDVTHIRSQIESGDPSVAEQLQPREVAFLLVFVSDRKDKDGRTSGSVLTEGTIMDTHQTLVASFLNGLICVEN
jgi:hypothetical protein